MPALGPRIGIEEIDLGDGGCREPGQQIDGVAGIKPDVVESTRLDLCQDFRHAVDERFAADEANLRVRGGSRDQILAAAEPDFEANRIQRTRKHVRKIGRRRPVKRKRNARQQCRQESGLVRPQPMTLAAAEEGAVAGCGMMIVRYRHWK